jgi:hypothetical protein
MNIFTLNFLNLFFLVWADFSSSESVHSIDHVSYFNFSEFNFFHVWADFPPSESGSMSRSNADPKQSLMQILTCIFYSKMQKKQ